MSSLDSLYSQVRKIVEQVGPPPEDHTVELTLSLFTEEEQAHIETLLHLIDHTFDHLYKLNDDQLDYLHAVSRMNELDGCESEQASTYRRDMAELSARPHFGLRVERLVEAFLSLDEQRIPDYAEVKEWWKQRESLPPDYPMRRAWYRQRKAWIEEVRDKSQRTHGDGLWGIGMYRAAEMGRGICRGTAIGGSAMQNITFLRRQVNAIMAKMEADQRRRDERCIVIYDPATGLPLPGYAPSPSAVSIIRLPDNGRCDRWHP
jgi:hypothetical protein